MSEEEFAKLLSYKRNSFSRNFLEIHKDALLNDNHQEEYSFTDLCILSALRDHPDITIHAIDEKQGPLSIMKFKDIFGDFSFEISLSVNNIVVYGSALRHYNFTENSMTNNFLLKTSHYIDAGQFCAAMTMNASYGIQDLLLVFWKCIYHYYDYEMSYFGRFFKAKLILNRDAWNLSTITFWPETTISLNGYTKIIDNSKILSQLKYAVMILDNCRLKKQ